VSLLSNSPPLGVKPSGRSLQPIGLKAPGLGVRVAGPSRLKCLGAKQVFARPFRPLCRSLRIVPHRHPSQ